MCPSLVHYSLFMCSITSVTFVFSLTQMFVFLSQNVMLNIQPCTSFWFMKFISSVLIKYLLLNLQEIYHACFHGWYLSSIFSGLFESIFVIYKHLVTDLLICIILFLPYILTLDSIH